MQGPPTGESALHDAVAKLVERVGYRSVVCLGHASCALSLLELWERPWSGTALRYTAHVLLRARRLGIDVLE